MMIDKAWGKKAYLLEFRSLDNNAVTDSFVFSVPPESEEFTLPKRYSETKTFDGSVIEDYGNDVERIVLSGSTINEEFRYIVTSNGSEEVRGEEEIFHLQELIKKYGQPQNLGKSTATIYCLDSQKNGIKWWDVVIESLQIRRSKDRPIAYTYTLSMIGYKAHTVQRERSSSWLDEVENKVKGWIDTINKGAEWLASGMENMREVLDYIARIKKLTTSFTGSLRNYINVVNGYIDLSGQIIKNSLNLGQTVVREAERIALGSGIDVLNQVAELNEAVIDVVDYVRNFPAHSISQDLLEQYGKTADEIVDAWRVVGANMESASAHAVATTRMECQKISYSVLPGGGEKSDQVVVVYGTKAHRATESDTYAKLAQDYLGSPDLGAMIAIYNNDGDIQTGDILNIPLTNKQDSVQGNIIYPKAGEIDNYGRDIAINDNGDIADFHGDIGLSSNRSNLSQAIESRLSTAINARLRMQVYGIRASVGAPEQAQNFIVSSVSRTLEQEPRIQTVDKIKFSGAGDSLNLSVEYTDVNGLEQTYGGKF